MWASFLAVNRRLPCGWVERDFVCTCMPHHSRELADYPCNPIPVFRVNVLDLCLRDWFQPGAEAEAASPDCRMDAIVTHKPALNKSQPAAG